MKKLGILLLVVMMSFVFFSCGSDDNEKAADKTQTQTEMDNKENQEDVNEDNADNDTSNANNQSSDLDSEDAALVSKYAGTWESKGLLLSDGSMDTTADKVTIVLKKDGTATVSTEKGTGSWDPDDAEVEVKINGKEIELSVDENGNLLYPTGERDGKGNILKYSLNKK